MRKILFLSLLVTFSLHAQNSLSQFFCSNSQRSRSDNIPKSHVFGVDDDYLTGYVQALIDMHYYEFQVRVIVLGGVAYIFNLPKNELISTSIVCFVHDIPCIGRVERVYASPCEFLACIQERDEQCAEELTKSSAFQSMCMMPGPDCGVRGIWFPQNTVLFQPLIADPTQVMNSAALRFNDNVIGQHVGAVVFGGDFIFFRWFDVLRWHGDMDIAIQAGVFSVFDLDHPYACMVNSDFFVAFMPTYAINRWSWRFRLWHLSSHIGDEYLLSYPDFKRCNLSDNGVDLFVSWQMNPAIRLYLGVGDIIWRDKEFYTQPFYLQWGAEIRVFGFRNCYNRLYVQPFLAMNFRSWEEHGFDINQTYALGVEWSKLQYVGQKFRIFGEFHNGYCVDGQFVQERSTYAAIRACFSF